MKKFLATLIMIVLAFCVCVTAGCKDKKTALEPSTAIKRAQELIKNRDFLYIDGIFSVDGKVLDTYTGTMDSELSYAEFRHNGADESYFGGMVAVKSDEGNKLERYKDFSALKNGMIGAIYLFKFDAENFEVVSVTDKEIVLDFLGWGAKYSFGGKNNWWKGRYVIEINDGYVTKTTLNTTIKENNTESQLISTISYGYPDKLWDKLPTIVPTDNVIFGRYILESLALANTGKYFEPSVPSDMGGMDVFVPFNSQVSKTACVSTGKSVTVIIEYSGKVISISQLYNANDLKRIEVTYNVDNLSVSHIYVGERSANNRYTLK